MAFAHAVPSAGNASPPALPGSRCAPCPVALPQPSGQQRRGQTSKDKAGPHAVPAVMMRDRADTEADLGTRPPLGETRDFSGAGSLEPPRRRPRPASRARGVECRAPVLLLRRRAWLRAAVSARESAGLGVSLAGLATPPLCPREAKPLPPHLACTPFSLLLSSGNSLFLHFLPALLALEGSTLQVPSSKPSPTPHTPTLLSEPPSLIPFSSPILTP